MACRRAWRSSVAARSPRREHRGDPGPSARSEPRRASSSVVAGGCATARSRGPRPKKYVLSSKKDLLRPSAWARGHVPELSNASLPRIGGGAFFVPESRTWALSRARPEGLGTVEMTVPRSAVGTTAYRRLARGALRVSAEPLGLSAWGACSGPPEIAAEFARASRAHAELKPFAGVAPCGECALQPFAAGRRPCAIVPRQA